LSYLIGASIIWLIAAPWLIFPDLAPFMTVLAMGALLVVRIGGRRWTGYLFPRTILDELLFLFLILVVVSFLISPLPWQSLPKLTIIFLGFFAYYLCHDWLRLSRKKQVDGLLFLMAILGVTGVALATALPFFIHWPNRQILFDFTFLSQNVPHLSEGYYVNPVVASGVLIVLLPFAIFFAIERTFSRPIRILAWIGSLWLIIMILATQSRSALLALVAMCVAIIIWSRFRLRWLFAAAGALAGIILVVYLASNVSLADVDHYARLLDLASKGNESSRGTWPIREEIWSASLKIFWEYPVTGVGLDMLVPVSRLNYVFNESLPRVNFTHAHNILLQSAANFGWVGLLIIAEILGLLLIGLWQAGRNPRSMPDGQQIASRDNPEHSFSASKPVSQIWFHLKMEWPSRIHPTALISIFGMSLVGFAVFNFMDVLSFWQRPGIFIWLIFAGSAVLVADARILTRWTHGLIFAPLVLLIVLVFSPAMSRNLANLRLDRARLLNDSYSIEWADQLDERRQGVAAFISGDKLAALEHFRNDPEAVHYLKNQGQLADYTRKHQAALKWYELALAIDSQEPEIYYWRGRSHEKLGNHDKALSDFEKATFYGPQRSLSESKQAEFFYNLSRLHANQQDWLDAESNIRHAISLKNDRPLYYVILGRALEGMGDIDGAEEAFEKARSLQEN